MAVIGFIRQESYEFKNQNGENQIVKWLEAHFRIAGLRPFKAKLSENKNRENQNAPAYYIYLRGNINKGDTFRDIRIGALWIKEKIDENGTPVKYMSGNMEVDFKEIGLYIQKPKKYFDDEKIGFLYEIISMGENKKDDVKVNEYNEPYSTFDSTNETEVNVDDEDIPF